nr:Xaa-Pro peptidase family protein [uncultured Desulfuromonas sp.]
MYSDGWKTPQEELLRRCREFQQHLVAQQIDLAIIVQNADLFYLTGSIQQGMLLVPCSGEPVYCVRRDLERARFESTLPQVVAAPSPRHLAEFVREQFGLSVETLGLELDVLPVTFYDRLKRPFGECAVKDVTPLLRRVRMIKSPFELGRMRKAADQLAAVYEAAKATLQEGITELELSAHLEQVARLSGHQGMTRMRAFNGEFYGGHVLSGAAGAYPTFCDAPLGGTGLTPAIAQGAGVRPIQAHEPVIIDFLGAYQGYLCDQTRTLCLGGLSDELVQGYDDLVEILWHMEKITKPGVSWGHVYDSCQALACEMGYKEAFMGQSGSQVGFIGHGIGTEIDEYPFIAKGFNDDLLEKNMTFAFEPKLVFPGIGALGIENTYVVTADGVEVLTRCPEQLVIL